MRLDHWLDLHIAKLLVPLAFWLLLNGLDDLFIALAALWGYVRRHFSTDPNERVPSEEELDSAPPRLIAIFVGLWKEHKVIRKMIANNVTQVRYDRVEFFIGAYPNDAPTLAAVREAMKPYANVHLSLCPHHGPTSKADNLNWIYQRMLLHEKERGVRFEMILTHDAEDMMDPDALRWINYYAQWNEFVQIPVLALDTPINKLIHGVYCDEFAEYQFKDMVARQTLGGFIPSNGVGTGFSRKALEAIAARHGNRIFEPACLTEDYENGFRVHRLGMKQKFIPIHFRHGRPIATREYFPFQIAKAFRQRSRWIMGITLQSWEFHSARDTLGNLYWFWRDRKSLVNNLVTPVTNLLFLYGAVTWVQAAATHHDWVLYRASASPMAACAAGLFMQAVQTAIRIGCSWRVYGLRFACAVPVRVVVANGINCLATSHAIWQYTRAKLAGHSLVWAKTDHAYHSPVALASDRRPLGAILVEWQSISPAQLEAALASKPPDRRLGEHLISLGLITEPMLYAALARQNSLPLGKPDDVSIAVARSLPASVARKWRVLPFRIAAGELYLAGADLPGEEMQNDIRRFSSLEIRFRLVTTADYEQLAAEYLNAPVRGY